MTREEEARLAEVGTFSETIFDKCTKCGDDIVQGTPFNICDGCLVKEYDTPCDPEGTYPKGDYIPF